MKTIIKLFALITLAVNSCILNAYSQSASYQSSITQNLQSPIRVAIDKNDVLLVIDDFQKLILKYNLNGTYLGAINPQLEPVSIAVNYNNQIFLGDGETGAIFMLDGAGNPIEFFPGTVFPASMVFGPDSNLYVVDSKYRRVVVINRFGEMVLTFGSGTFTYPVGITYDTKNNRVLISEHGGIGPGFNPVEKVWLYTPQGTLISSFGSHGNLDGRFYRIQGMAVGRCGNIFIPDPYLGRVSVFRENATFLTKFGVWGDTLGYFYVPLDIVIDSQDRILITSMNNGSVEIYNFTDTLPTSGISTFTKYLCSGDSANIPIHFTGTSPWSFIYTIDGLNQDTITTSDNPYILNTTFAGVYQVNNIADQNYTGTCKSGYAKIVVTNTLPTANILTSETQVCNNEMVSIPVELTGSAPWSLTYTHDGSGPVTVNDIITSPFIINGTEAGIYEVISLTGGGCIGNSITASHTIVHNNFPSALFAAASDTLHLCPGEIATVPLTFSGTAPYTFVYSQDETIFDTISGILTSNYDLQLNSAGTFRIKSVSDANCSKADDFDEITIVVHPNQQSNIITESASICPGDTASMEIEFAGTLPWSFTYNRDGSNSVTVTNVQTSPYYLSVTEPGTYEIISLSGQFCSGYSVNGQMVLSNKPTPVANMLVTSGTACYGENVVLPIEFSGNMPYSFTYLVNGTNNVQVSGIYENSYNLTASESGIYSISEITDQNCTGIIQNGSADITIMDLPTGIMESDTMAICDGQDAYLYITLSGTPPFDFVYTINETDTFSVLNIPQEDWALVVSEPGIYELIEVRNGDCVGPASGKVELIPASPPVINLGNDTVVCEGSVITLNPGSFNFYFWSDLSDAQTINVTSSGNYIVTVFDANFCRATDEINISVQEVPVASLNQGMISLCEGQTANIEVNFTGNPPYTFTYTKDGSTPLTISNTNINPYIINVVEGGTYELTHVSSGICDGSVSGSVTVNVSPLPVVNLGPELEICEGNSAVLDAGTFVSYLWSDNSTGQQLNVNTPGFYSVTVTDQTGCQGWDGVSVSVNLSPIPLFTYSLNGQEVSFYNNSQFSTGFMWDFGDGNTSTEISPVHQYTNSGTYTVTLTAANQDCQSTYLLIINVTLTNVTTSTENFLYKVYPNPSSGIYNLEMSVQSNDIARIELYNTTGNLIYSKELNKVNGLINETIDIRNYSSGIYNLRIIRNNKLYSEKLILVE